MKRFYVLIILVFVMFANRGFGQVGEKVAPVNVLNVQNQTISLPMLGQKNLLIFYANPKN